MHSGVVEAARTGWRSLVARVALGGTLASAAGGAVAALAAGYAAHERIARYEQEGVSLAVNDLALELDEEIAEGGDDDDYPTDQKTLDDMLAHELADVKMPGARASLWKDRSWVGGDRSLVPLPMGECHVYLESNLPARACSIAFHDQILTLSVSALREREQGQLFREAILIGVFAGAVLGALISIMTARWGLHPLSVLQARVGQIDARDPRANSLGTPTSVSEVEALRSVIESLVERLAASLAQAQAFAGEAAHELRTPLTTIAGELELLRDALRDDDQRHLQRVHDQVRGLIGLVQRLLAIAQPGDSDWSGVEAVDLGEVAESVLGQLAPKERVRIQARIDDEILVRGDSALLSTLLENAIGNALKFSSDAVEVRVSGGGELALIEVFDRGPGVPETERERVFAPFYRTAAARATGTRGHGLGLALIARVAQAHGGQAEFVEVRQGAHLRISIPMWRGRSA